MSEIDILRQRLAEAEAELEQFAYSASHDLHAPIRAILHFASHLRRRSADRLEERDRSVLDHMMDEARRAQRLIDALLEFSRLGSQNLQFEACDLRDILQAAESQVREQFGAARWTLIRDDELPPVRGDAGLLTILFVELISNAIQFNKADQASVRIGRDPDSGLLWVRDNGIGIRAAAQERVFEMFNRQHHPGEYGDGLGVGLAKARKIARLHGGRIWIESGDTGGSTVYLQLGQDA